MKLYNTLSRTIEEFEPIDSPNVRMYTCGPTVYREIHIGNFRTYLTSDLLRRVLETNGYKVKSVMNITDVGHMRFDPSHGHQIDPLIEEALALGKKPLDIAQNYTEKFFEDSKKLNLLPHDIYPRATEHIPEMIKMIKTLLDKGFAYETNGTIYFNIRKFKKYGALSGNTLDKMDQLLEAVRVSVETDKKDSADFALWKKAEEGRLMKWNSPWGEGFPGWHIECSAMSQKYLGDSFDIHIGGEDLIFPHHEDEIAQSEAVTDSAFVKYWVHSNYLLVEGEKMSRSKRNIYTISDLEKKRFSALSFRYLSYQTHYRTRMNFTWEALEGAKLALNRIYERASNFNQVHKYPDIEFEREFLDALSGDLNTPRAVSIMWEMLGSDIDDSVKARTLFKMDEVLGLSIKENAAWLRNIPELIMKLVGEREILRKNKQFVKADHLRSRIEKMGYILDDVEEGTRVLRKL